MPTDNPKISLYVPQQIYDHFKEFQSEQNLSMSQAGIVILAEYFGIEETIKEITRGATVGGVTLARFEELEKRLKEIEEKVNQIETNSKPPKIKNKSLDKILDKPLVKDNSIDRKSKKSQVESKQFNLIEEAEEKILITESLLSQRLGFSNPRSIGNKRRVFYKQTDIMDANINFSDWSKNKDPDKIGWQPIQQGKKSFEYTPSSKLSGELNSKLLKWIAKNQN